MIIARLSNGSVLVGITQENVDRLKDGKPLVVKHATVGDITGDVVVVYGENLDKLVDELQPVLREEDFAILNSLRERQ